MAPRGLQEGAALTVTLPRPRGLGRGSRPLQQQLNPFLEPETRRAYHSHEALFIKDTAYGTSKSYNVVHRAPHSRDSNAGIEGLPRSASMLVLNSTQRKDQVSHNAETKSGFWRKSISQPHVAYRSANNGQLISGRTVYGVATRIPMCWGDAVVIYVNNLTCWIPIEFLGKVFNWPGTLLASSATCCKRGSGMRPTNSVCYYCYSLIKIRFDRLLSRETKPILGTLELILDNKFKKESGLSLDQCDWQRCISDQ